MDGRRGSRMSPERRRDQIADVAAAMIEANGVDGLSMTALAEAAGVTRALVHRYFPRREDVIAAVLGRAALDLLDATEPRRGATVRENLEQSLAAYRDRFAPKLDRLEAGTGSRSFVDALAAHARGVQVERIRSQLVDPDEPGTTERLHAWLALAEDLATAAPPEYVDWCLGALSGLLGDNLDLNRPTPP